MNSLTFQHVSRALLSPDFDFRALILYFQRVALLLCKCPQRFRSVANILRVLDRLNLRKSVRDLVKLDERSAKMLSENFRGRHVAGVNSALPKKKPLRRNGPRNGYNAFRPLR